MFLFIFENYVTKILDIAYYTVEPQLTVSLGTRAMAPKRRLSEQRTYVHT